MIFRGSKRKRGRLWTQKKKYIIYIYIYIYIYRERERERGGGQTDRQTVRQTDREEA